MYHETKILKTEYLTIENSGHRKSRMPTITFKKVQMSDIAYFAIFVATNFIVASFMCKCLLVYFQHYMHPYQYELRIQ